MNKFYVGIKEIWINKFPVDAESEDQAVLKAFEMIQDGGRYFNTYYSHGLNAYLEFSERLGRETWRVDEAVEGR